MARKKSPAPTSASAPPPPPEESDRQGETRATIDPERAHALASPVAASVELVNVFLVESHVRRSVKAYKAGDDVHISVGVGEPKIEHNDPITGFSVQIQFTVTAVRKDAAEGDQPAVEMHPKFVILYKLAEAEGVTAENLIAFALTSGVFSVWPYVRELVHSVSLQVGVPSIVLPTYRL